MVRSNPQIIKPPVSPIVQALTVFSMLGLVFCATLVILVGTAELTLVNPAAYKQAISAQGLYARMPEMLAQQMTFQEIMTQSQGLLSFKNGLPPAGQKGLSQEDNLLILQALLPPDWLEAQGNSVIDQIFAFFNPTSGDLTLKIPLEDLKGRLMGEAGALIVQKVLASMPNCDLQTLAKLALTGKLNALPLCRPPSQLMPLVTSLAEGILHQSASQIPDVLDILQMKGGAALGKSILQARAVVQMVRSGVRLLLIATLGFMALLTLATHHSAKTVLMWWGVSALVNGLLVLAGCALLYVGYMYGSGVLAGAVPAAWGEELRAMTVAAYGLIWPKHVLWAGMAGAALVPLGAGIWGIGYLIR
jgi:hypothetical protein